VGRGRLRTLVEPSQRNAAAQLREAERRAEVCARPNEPRTGRACAHIHVPWSPPSGFRRDLTTLHLSPPSSFPGFCLPQALASERAALQQTMRASAEATGEERARLQSALDNAQVAYGEVGTARQKSLAVSHGPSPSS